MKRKEFQIGIELESNTEYFATQKEYHVYTDQTKELCDDRYVALRAHDVKNFKVFVLIKKKKNITLDFCGATLVMHGKIQPFLIDLSENVTIKNCKVTYDRPPYTEALILEASSEYARIRLNENCPCRLEDGMLIPYSDSWECQSLNVKGCFFQVFDRQTRKGCGLSLGVLGNHIKLDPDWPYHPKHFIAEADGEDIILKGKIPEFYQPDRVLVISHEIRSLSSVFIIDSKNTVLESYRILSGWGMGIYAYRAENITLNKLILTHDKESPCIIANSADAVHSFGTSGQFTITDSIFEGMIDDAVNIHSNFRTVKKVNGSDIYTDLASCEPQANDLYRVGDEIAVYKGKTMEKSASYIIKKIEAVEEKVMKFTVDRPVGAHLEGDLIESITANCDVRIENCIFGKANSHLRLQSRGKFILKNCETELPLLLSRDASFWFESGPLTDLTVENCRFIGKRAGVYVKSEIFPTKAEPYYHRNLKFFNNVFDVDIPFKGGYADNIVFKGNKNALGLLMCLKLTNCGFADGDNCEIERKTEVKDKLKIN